MKASEFCSFFDFTLVKENGYVDEDFYSGDYQYRATDDQGVFHDRYAADVKDLADEFDSMLQDYVDDDLEYNGFEPPATGDYYEAALQWLETSELKNTDIHDVVKVLVNPNELRWEE